MKRRDVLRRGHDVVGRAGLLLGTNAQGEPMPQAPAVPRISTWTAGDSHQGHPDDPDRAESHQAGRGQGDHRSAWTLRVGLRDLHPARAGRADGDRSVSEAVSDRPPRR